MAAYKYIDIPLEAGFNLDDPESSTALYTDGHWIRFMRGKPRIMGGYDIKAWDTDPDTTTIDNAPITSIHNQFVEGRNRYLYGTATGLYSTVLVNSEFTNITPLQDDTIAIASSIDTNFLSLPNNPFQAIGATTIAITYTGIEALDLLRVGDVITISGATGFGATLAGDLNKQHIVRAISADTIIIILTSGTISIGSSGGGNAAKMAINIIDVNHAAHGLREGERIKLNAAADTGGILAADINKEHIVREHNTDSFRLVLGAYPTSAVTAGGGASTTYQKQIADGAVNASTGIGYGYGEYGAGEYGTAKISDNVDVQPRIWSMDSFGQQVLVAPGQGGKVYVWGYDSNTAPVEVQESPDANYLFVMRNYPFVLDGSTIRWAHPGNYDQWTPGVGRRAGFYPLFKATELVSHAAIREDIAIIYSDTQSFIMRFTGDDALGDWDVAYLSDQGIFSARTRFVVNGIAYWMSENGFYMYDGGVREIECPIKEWLFAQIDLQQRAKAFADYNQFFGEVRFWVPDSSGSCRTAAVLDLKTGTWRPIKQENMPYAFTAAEPQQLGDYPVLAQESRAAEMERGISILTENAVAMPLQAFIETPWISPSSDATMIRSLLWEATQSGDVEVTLYGRDEVQNDVTEKTIARQAVSSATGRVSLSTLERRYFKMRVDIQRNSDFVDSTWQAGRIRMEVTGGKMDV